ncbi:MAG: DUF177 domain-containing protein [Porphyromonadaceae bacterium]|nr:DUF177 domain-containing protein [Porphyromonadaceae bacterium]
MSKFSQYNIPLRGLATESQTYDFVLDNSYFQKIDSPEVQHGNVKCTITVKKKTNLFELSFNVDGIIRIPCDRCLDEMDQVIRYKDKLQVKLGEKFAEEGDIVIIPESEGEINVAWFMYELIVLNIPLKHVHAPGECNKTMVGKLKKHITRQKSDDDDISDLDFDDTDDDVETDEVPTDPRWDGLQNIFENN